MFHALIIGLIGLELCLGAFVELYASELERLFPDNWRDE